MNEAETRAELIDPKLKAAGWGVVEGSKVLREYHITAGKIQTGGVRAKPLIADYVLVHQNRKLAVAQAKLGSVASIRATFIEFQKYLYAKKAAWFSDVRLG